MINMEDYSSETAEPFDWQADLLREKNGNLKKRSIRNALLFLRNDPEIAGRIGYNEFSNRVEAIQRLPWSSSPQVPRELTDVDSSRLCEWLEVRGQDGFTRTSAGDLFITIAQDQPFHPLREFLLKCHLKWDKKSRIGRWLNYYCGAADNDYTRAVGRKFLIGAVARVLRPGCKMDNMLILEGKQGIGKSSLFRSLFGAEFSTDSLSAFGTKDAAQEIQGRWCIEIAELAQFGKVDMRHIKEALSKDRDRFRPPFGRLPEEFKRQCVFVGTCNPGGNGWQKDETGARRFWPVVTDTIDLPALIADRSQIWGEAVDAFYRGENWWLEGDEIFLAEAEQEERYDEDVWMAEIDRFCVLLPETTIPEILRNGLNIDPGKQTKSDQMRVATCLRKLGYMKVTKRFGKRITKAWIKKEETVETGGNEQFSF